jgi:hypothetical protein
VLELVLRLLVLLVKVRRDLHAGHRGHLQGTGAGNDATGAAAAAVAADNNVTAAHGSATACSNTYDPAAATNAGGGGSGSGGGDGGAATATAIAFAAAYAYAAAVAVSTVSWLQGHSNPNGWDAGKLCDRCRLAQYAP